MKARNWTCLRCCCDRTATWRGEVQISRICSASYQSGSALPSVERAGVTRKGGECSDPPPTSLDQQQPGGAADQGWPRHREDRGGAASHRVPVAFVHTILICSFPEQMRYHRSSCSH